MKVGRRMDCYVNPRQKSMKLLGRWPCVKIQDIFIAADLTIWVDGVRLVGDEMGLLAESDGFTSFSQMMNFWDGRLPCEGYIYHWDPDKPMEVPRKPRRRRSRKQKGK